MKRLLSVFMALAILFTSAAAEFPFTAVTAQAANAMTVNEAVSWIKARADESWWRDIDGVFGCQCVDLIYAYYEALGYSRLGGNACDYASSSFGIPSGSGWYKDSTPSPGAIIAWPGNTWTGQWTTGYAGHVGLVYAVSGSTVYTVETNTKMPGNGTKGEANAVYCTRTPQNAVYIHPFSNGSTTHTHNYQFKYFLAEHPHRDYYECSCGDGYTNSSSSRFYAAKGCSQCCATITPGTYNLVNKGTGQALDLYDNTDANLQNIHLYTHSTGNKAQQMVISLRSSSDKSYKIRPTISNRLIQTYGDYGVTTSGMNVNIYDDVNDNTQWWHFQAVSGGYVIRNAANTSCALTASNGNAIVSTYTGSANQIWTLQAISAAQKYYIAYNANGGSGTMANTEMTVGTAANLRANAFTRTGYTFLGWSTSASATTATYTDKQSVKDLAKSGTVTLYAVWKANGTANGVQSQIDKLKAVYPTGSYFSKDGKIDNGTNHTTINGIICQNCYLPNIPARGGLPAGSAVGYTAEQCASFAYYAYYVIFGHNHGTKTTNTTTPVLGDMIHVENTSTGAQHWFIYLSEDSSNYYVYDANYGYTQQVNYNHALGKSGYNKVTIYHATDYSSVQPAAQKYTVAYNANGGSGTMANTEMTVGTAANLRANAFTRTGYTFLGWSTSASATTVTYTDKQSVKDLAKSGTVTLYAVWSRQHIYSTIDFCIPKNAEGASLDTPASLVILNGDKLVNNLFLENCEIDNFEVDLLGMADGTYSFIFSAANCARRTYDVTVSNGTLSLKNVELHLYGDINGDGKINGTDVLKAKLHAKGSQRLSGYDLSVADVTQDSKINGTDVLKLKLHAKGSTRLW